MTRVVSNTEFKAKTLEYLREVERSRCELIVSDKGRPVVRVVPYVGDPAAVLEALRGSVLRYEDPTEPVEVQA